jgi:hypothetical protein
MPVREPPALSSIVAPNASSQTDEESIELYMSKLMQRMRGDTVRTPSSQSPASSAANAPNTNKPVASIAAAERSIAPHAVRPGGSVSDGPMENLHEMRRRSSVPERGTDLEAMRRLANESTRQAIVTHATHKFRQATITKLIVATLAGSTSVYMMLNAPGWQSTQFVGACVALFAAIVWVFFTFRSLADTFRARSYEGLASMDEYSVSEDPWSPQLPIDVEGSAKHAE